MSLDDETIKKKSGIDPLKKEKSIHERKINRPSETRVLSLY